MLYFEFHSMAGNKENFMSDVKKNGSLSFSEQYCIGSICWFFVKYDNSSRRDYFKS